MLALDEPRLDRQIPVCGGHALAPEAGLDNRSGGVEQETLDERRPEPLDHTAAHLACGPAGVDDATRVVHRDDSQRHDPAGLAVHLDLRELCARDEPVVAGAEGARHGRTLGVGERPAARDRLPQGAGGELHRGRRRERAA